MHTTKPPGEADYAPEPCILPSNVPNSVGLTREYRQKLNELTRYLQSSKAGEADVARFTRNLITNF